MFLSWEFKTVNCVSFGLKNESALFHCYVYFNILSVHLKNYFKKEIFLFIKQKVLWDEAKFSFLTGATFYSDRFTGMAQLHKPIGYIVSFNNAIVIQRSDWIVRISFSNWYWSKPLRFLAADNLTFSYGAMSSTKHKKQSCNLGLALSHHLRVTKSAIFLLYWLI